MPRTAVITGISGQDGSYLAELLLRKGYAVHGLVRRASLPGTGRIDHLLDDITLHYGDMADQNSLHNLLTRIDPDEIYNLAAQSHVAVSFQVPENTMAVNAGGTLCLLDTMRETKSRARLYQASTSELFGGQVRQWQSETTPFHPRSPYAVSKLAAYWAVVNYREAYGLFACNGILFNHESPRRSPTFVTRKIAAAAAAIACGQQDTLVLGNLYAERDWGYAPEYVEAMWMMLQEPSPADYVIATGEAHTVKEFVSATFAHLGMPLTWNGGSGIHEVARDAQGIVRVAVDPRYYRPAEVEYLRGDAAKAHRVLGWRPKTTFPALVKLMADAELQKLRRELSIPVA